MIVIAGTSGNVFFKYNVFLFEVQVPSLGYKVHYDLYEKIR